MRHNSVSDLTLITILQVLHEKNKKVPTRKDIDNDPALPSVTTYISHFGSWKGALKAAGFDKDLQRDERIIAELEKSYKACGYPNIRWMKEHGAEWAVAAAIKRYGSWCGAMIELGYADKHDKQRKKEIARGIHELSLRLGRKPTKDEISAEPSLPHFDTCVRAFGKRAEMYAAANNYALDYAEAES